MSPAVDHGERRGLLWAALLVALMVVALGLALWPQGQGGRSDPPMQAWPNDAHMQGTASAECPADKPAAPAGSRGT